MNQTINIKFDKFITSCANSWLVEIAGQHCYFPYSLCELDEVSKVMLCPLWLAVEKELEDFIDE